MASLTVGDSYRATSMCRELVNAQLSPLFISVDTQDLMDDLMKYKERALSVHIAKLLPGFTLNTPGMRRRAKVLDTLMQRVQDIHTPRPTGGQPAGPGGRLPQSARERTRSFSRSPTCCSPFPRL